MSADQSIAELMLQRLDKLVEAYRKELLEIERQHDEAYRLAGVHERGVGFWSISDEERLKKSIAYHKVSHERNIAFQHQTHTMINAIQGYIQTMGTLTGEAKDKLGIPKTGPAS